VRATIAFELGVNNRRHTSFPFAWFCFISGRKDGGKVDDDIPEIDIKIPAGGPEKTDVYASSGAAGASGKR